MKLSIETVISRIDKDFINDNPHITHIDNSVVYIYNKRQVARISNSKSYIYSTQTTDFIKAYLTNGCIGLLNNKYIKYITNEDTKFIVSLPCKIQNIIQIGKIIVLIPQVDIQYLFKLDKCYDVPEPVYFNILKIAKEISQDIEITFNCKEEPPVFTETTHIVDSNSFAMVFKGRLKGNQCNILIDISIDKISQTNTSINNYKRNNSTLIDSCSLSYTDIIKPKDLPETSINDLEISYNGLITLGIGFIFKGQGYDNFNFLICNSNNNIPKNQTFDKLQKDSFKDFIYYVYNKKLNLLIEYKFESLIVKDNRNYIVLEKIKETECLGIFPLKEHKNVYNGTTTIITELFCVILKTVINICYGNSIIKQQKIETDSYNFIIQKTVDFAISKDHLVILLETQICELKIIQIKVNLEHESLLDDVLLIYKQIYGCNEFYKLINIHDKKELVKRIKNIIYSPNKALKVVGKIRKSLTTRKQELFYQYCYILMLLNKTISHDNVLSVDNDEKYIIELINSIYANYTMNNISQQTFNNFLSIIDSKRFLSIKNLNIQRPILSFNKNKQLYISKRDVNLQLFCCKNDINYISPSILNPLAFLELYGNILLNKPYSHKTNPQINALCDLYSVDAIKNLIINQPLNLPDTCNTRRNYIDNHDNSLTANKEENTDTLDSDQKYIFDNDISHINNLSKKVLRMYSVQFPVVFKSKGNLDQTMGKHEACKKVKGMLIQYLLKRCFIIYGKLALVLNNKARGKNNELENFKEDNFKQVSLEGLIVPENIKLIFEENEITDISKNLNIQSMLEVTKFLNQLSFFLNSEGIVNKKENSASDFLAKTLANKKITFELSKDLSEFWRCTTLQQNSILLGSSLSYTNTNSNVYKVSKTKIEKFLISEIPQFNTELDLQTETGNNCIALISLGLMNFKDINKKYINRVKTYFIQKVKNKKENTNNESDSLVSYFISFFVAAVSFKQYKTIENLKHTKSILKYVSNYKQFNDRDVNIANSIITGCLFYGSNDKNIAKAFYKNNNLRFQEEDPKVVYFSSLCYYLIMNSKLNDLNDVKKFLSSSNPTLLDINDLQHYAAKILITGIVNRNSNSLKLKNDLIHIYNEYSNIYLDGSDFNNFSGSYVETFFAVVMLSYTLLNTDETNEGIFDDIKNDMFLISTENTLGMYYYSVAGALESSNVKFNDSDISTFYLLLSFIDHHQLKNYTENTNGLLKLLFLKAVKTKNTEINDFPFNNNEKVYTLKEFDEYLTSIKFKEDNGNKIDLHNKLKEKIVRQTGFINNPFSIGLIKLLDLDECEQTIDCNTNIDSVKRKIIVDKIFEICKNDGFMNANIEDRCIYIFDCLQNKMEQESYLYNCTLYITLQDVVSIYKSEFNVLNK